MLCLSAFIRGFLVGSDEEVLATDGHGPRMDTDKNKELVLDVMFIGVYPRLPGWFG
jgi:hypothetical protein